MAGRVIHLSDEAHAQLKRYAAEQGVSMTQVIETLIELSTLGGALSTPRVEATRSGRIDPTLPNEQMMPTPVEPEKRKLIKTPTVSAVAKKTLPPPAEEKPVKLDDPPFWKKDYYEPDDGHL